MKNFVTLTSDIGCELKYTKEEFIREVKGFIENAINERDYNISDLSPVFILQDITNRLDTEDFGVSMDVMICIYEQLNLYTK